MNSKGSVTNDDNKMAEVDNIAPNIAILRAPNLLASIPAQDP